MKKIIKSIGMLLMSIVTLIMAIIVTLLLKPLGWFYTIPYMIFFLFKDPSRIINLWVTFIEGTIKNLAWLITKVAVWLDLNWNVGGSSELLEDFNTATEDSWFNNPLTTVSASIGKHEIDNDLVDTGTWLSKLLNVVFREKTHGASSYRKEKMIKDFNEREFGSSDRLM